MKPQDALAALREMGGALAGKLLVSIVAGLPLAALQSAAAPGARLVRVMPNTPALIHRGATAYALGDRRDGGRRQRDRSASSAPSARWRG